MNQYWITKNAKKLQRKFNAKEDENIVHSDIELDSKLELFKSISESTSNLSNIVEKYRDSLNVLANETAYLGQFLKDYGKSSSSSSTIMVSSGKVINYLGQQHFTAMSGLARNLQELNTFKRAVNDSKDTIQAMEKERTEYRASLMLMKNCSADIDPDSGRGLEKFRTSQKYVKFAKQKFDKFSLACLQKIDLLSTSRCNLFSYSLASYQNNWLSLSQKNEDVLEAHLKIIEKEPRKHTFGILKDLAQEVDGRHDDSLKSEPIDLNDKDQRLFFGEEFSDSAEKKKKEENINKSNHMETNEDSKHEKLIDYETFDEFMNSSNILLPSQLLMDDFLLNSNDETQSNVDLLGSLVPKQMNELQPLGVNNEKNNISTNNNLPKKANDLNKWFQLFSELDPLNQQQDVKEASENMHAA